MSNKDQQKYMRMKNKTQSKQGGFSLIELLVVISIIGVLAAVLLPNMVGMRQRARDSQVKQNLAQLKSALRLYYNDHQTYPPNNDTNDLVACGANGTTVCASGDSFARDAVTYMQAVPGGNLAGKEDLYYEQVDNGDGFIAAIILENVSDEEVDTATTLGSSGERCGVDTTGIVEGRYYVCSF